MIGGKATLAWPGNGALAFVGCGFAPRFPMCSTALRTTRPAAAPGLRAGLFPRIGGK
jgi:hypothetical protein